MAEGGGWPGGTRFDVYRVGAIDDVRITLPDGSVIAEVTLPTTGRPAQRIVAALCAVASSDPGADK